MSVAGDVRAIFLAAVDKPPQAEREAYLAEACGDDAELRRRVEALLAACNEPASFLERPAVAADPQEAAPTLVAESIREESGSAIGPYKLLQEIGQGGMGVVFMAEQTTPVRRKVALKIIKPGMDSQQVIARFEAERQALAMMEHQNIARVLDAGATEAGRPYFVMELVKGVPITDYCNHNRLTPRERLELFIPVCEAIQHAHQKGIIHRDIKPSNVLVSLYDGRPVPKVIDFGVAKAIEQRLTERTMFTQFGQIVGTLEYMSPEQAQLNQLDIDTRSDVYSLGVLLYELLTGGTPFSRERLRSAAFEEVLRVIREEEPVRPSTRLGTSATLAAVAARRRTEPKKLSALVRGELDWIVMKALEKDRGRRYETANAFARDVQNYLADEPVAACPPSAAYRFRKFARRNKVSLTMALLIISALAVSVVALGFSNIRVARERNATVLALVERSEALRKERAALEEKRAALRKATEQERLAKGQEKVANAQRIRAEGLAEKERLYLYAARIKLAHQAWETGDTARVLELLDSVRPAQREQDLRGFEWHYLWQLCHSQRHTLRGHAGAIHAVAYSAAGEIIATGGEDGIIKLREAPFVQEKRALEGHVGRVMSLSFSPGGKLLATGGQDRTIRLWNTATGEQTAVLEGHTAPVSSVAFSSDGTMLASGSAHLGLGTGDPTARFLTREAAGETKLWNVSTGRESAGFDEQTGGVLSVALSPDGGLLAVGTRRGQVVVHDLKAEAVAAILSGHSGAVFSVAFSQDGRSLASGSYDHSVKLWDVAA
ncbi:MAG: serine/threonine protein kinase, partial [Planctomycetes bacterium]|nr:serine/threonine protein kinase [Planctomycetota bacterium]